MAVGEKRSVVMGAEKAAPNGVATLGADGKLSENQRPDATGMGAANRTLSNLTDPQTALYNLGAGVRPNLLINGLFMIDQRSNGPYQNKYGPDGWTTFENATATFDNPGVTLTPGEATNGGMNQFLEPIDSGMFTLSALFDNGDICWAVYAVSENGQSIEQTYMHKGNTIDTFTLGYAANIAKNYVQFRVNKQTKFLGAKLEPGEGQTLAYQDSSGDWKLLPQPGMDLGTQLLRCQRYFQLYSSADARPNSPIDCRPVMRMPAGGQLTQGTIMIDGVTYYYNSAEL